MDSSNFPEEVARFFKDNPEFYEAIHKYLGAAEIHPEYEPEKVSFLFDDIVCAVLTKKEISLCATPNPCAKTIEIQFDDTPVLLSVLGHVVMCHIQKFAEYDAYLDEITSPGI